MALARNQITHVSPKTPARRKTLATRPGEMEEAAGQKGCREARHP